MPAQTLSHAADVHLHKATHFHPWCVQEVHTQKQRSWRISLLLKQAIDPFFDYFLPESLKNDIINPSDGCS